MEFSEGMEVSHADGSYLGGEKIKSSGVIPYDAGDSSKMAIGMDLSDMTASMQEALHRSSMDVRYYMKTYPSILKL